MTASLLSPKVGADETVADMVLPNIALQWALRDKSRVAPLNVWLSSKRTWKIDEALQAQITNQFRAIS
jgi:hypothetical protein